MEFITLPCTDRRKSFYGKAKVWHDGNRIILRSYNTDVAMIDDYGNFIKLWDGYSATTMRHINSFLDYTNKTGGGKKWWDELEAIA